MNDAVSRCQPSIENTLRELGDTIFLGLAVDNWLAKMPIETRQSIGDAIRRAALQSEKTP